jgi:signal transduction histidine kinase
LILFTASIIMINFKGLVLKQNCLQMTFIFLITLLIHLNSSSQDISFNVSIAIPTNNRSPDQVIKQLRLTAIHFIRVRDNRINFGIVGSQYHYILLKLISDNTPQEKYLSIDNTSLDTVSIYKLHADATGLLIYLGGNLVPFNESRNYVWHTAPINISKTPSYYLIAVKAAQKNINIRYDILDSDALQKRYEVYQRFVFFYMGIVSMIAIVMLIALLLFKKTVFGAYLGYTICAGGWILTHYGCIFPLVFPQWPWITEIIKPICSLGASFFLLIVLLQVFKISLKPHPWLQPVLKGTVAVIFLLMVLMFFLLKVHLNSNIKIALVAAWQIGLISSIFIIVFTPLSLIHTGYTAKIISVAMLVICVMTIIQQIANLGYINNFFINEHAITMASLLEISIMAFGLFYNFYQEKKQKEKQVMALEQERTETLKKLITLQDNERKRIAADLHDNLGPLLAALKINFRRIIHNRENLKEDLADKTESIIDDSIAEIRNVAHNLMPKGLSANGLINTLNEYFEGISQLYNKKLFFHHQIDTTLSAELQTNMYRIICELVLNAARHSKAELINVSIKNNNKMITVSIDDNGQGFIRKLNGQVKTLGLQSAQSRVLYMKGLFNLQSEKGKGTLIDIEIPLQFNQTNVGSF